MYACISHGIEYISRPLLRTFMGMPASASAIAAALMHAQRVPPSACSTCKQHNSRPGAL
jgi:hypothetical protein